MAVKCSVILKVHSYKISEGLSECSVMTPATPLPKDCLCYKNLWSGLGQSFISQCEDLGCRKRCRQFREEKAFLRRWSQHYLQGGWFPANGLCPSAEVTQLQFLRRKPELWSWSKDGPVSPHGKLFVVPVSPWLLGVLLMGWGESLRS